jgi:hypothetical protein
VDAGEFERVPGLLAPGQSVQVDRIPELSHRVTINALGYRGEPVTREKPRDVIRVVMLGDSFTYGEFVDDSVTVPALLQKALADACGPVEVVNGGVGGTTVVTHAAMAARAGVLDPDLVLLMVYENDVINLRDPLWDQMADNRRVKSRFPMSLVYRTMRGSALWQLALQARANLRMRKKFQQDPEAYGEGGELPRELQDEYRARLATLRDSLRGEGTPFVVTAYPSHNEIFRDSVAAQVRWVEALAEEMGIPYGDIHSVLRDSGLGPTEIYLLPHDGHGSPRAHRMVAARLAEVLRDQPPFRDRCGSDGG